MKIFIRKKVHFWDPGLVPTHVPYLSPRGLFGYIIVCYWKQFLIFEAYKETQIPRATPLKNSRKATKIPIWAFCLIVISTKFVQSVASRATKAARAEAIRDKTEPDLKIKVSIKRLENEINCFRVFSVLTRQFPTLSYELLTERS